MHERFGDGAATAAVLSRAMVREASQRIAAGVDPVSIREVWSGRCPLPSPRSPPIDTGRWSSELWKRRRDRNHRRSRTWRGARRDRRSAGSDAAITIEEFPVPYLDREYVAGAAWRAHPAARAMIPEGRQEIVLENALIMLVDQRLTEFDDVRPALELALQSPGRRPLLIIAAKIDDHALATIIANHARGTDDVDRRAGSARAARRTRMIWATSLR